MSRRKKEKQFDGSIKKSKIGQRARSAIANGFIYIILAVMGICWILPLLFLVYTAFRVTPNTGIINKLFPDNLELGWGNFVRLFKETAFGDWVKNTFIVALCSCIICTIFVLMVSFAFSRTRFKGRKTLMNIMLILGMFPGFMAMTAIYFILKAMNLTDSLFGLIVAYSASGGMGYYICKGFLDTIPKSLEEAAMLDGASRWKIFWRMIFPLSKPIIVYTVLTSFIGPWCDFIFAKLIITSKEPSDWTVAVGLYNLINQDAGAFNSWFTVFCAGSVIVGGIIMIIYPFMQRCYSRGVLSGAVK